MSIRDMVDSIMTDDEQEEQIDASSGGNDLGGGGGLMGDDGGDDDGGGGGGGGDDDLGGLGGLDDGEGDLGGLDDDGFGDMEGGDDAMAGGGGNVDELEHRLDELENEVGSLSSTVNTVRNENEQISDSVEEVEENVRKLLDIYEMVTRGVNPFADEMDAGMGMGGGGMDAQDGSFGLFTDDEEESQDDSVDEDVADADAEGFFDDDLVDDEPDKEIDADVDADVDEGMGDEGDDFDDVGGGFDEVDDDGFEDVGGEMDDGFDDVGDEMGDDFEDVGGEMDDGFDDAGGEMNDKAGDVAETGLDGSVQQDDPVGDAVEEKTGVDEPAQAGAAPEPNSTDQTASESAPQQATDAGKPYLSGVPQGITEELLVLEWLEYLVDEVGNRRASEAINYYESIDWLTEESAADLESHLDRFEPRERGPLTVSVHRQSLSYIHQLNGDEMSPSFHSGGPL